MGFDSDILLFAWLIIRISILQNSKNLFFDFSGEHEHRYAVLQTTFHMYSEHKAICSKHHFTKQAFPTAILDQSVSGAPN